MSRSLGIPVKLLHESTGHVVTVEMKSGELYRGSMLECEDNWNCQLENITYTAKDGRVSQLEHVFIRGSKVRFMIIPDMLKNAPMFKRLDAKIKGKGTSLGVGRGRAIAMRAKAQAAGRGAAPGRGVVPPVFPIINKDDNVWSMGESQSWPVYVLYGLWVVSSVSRLQLWCIVYFGVEYLRSNSELARRRRQHLHDERNIRHNHVLEFGDDDDNLIAYQLRSRNV
nr:small nuclear ribonucleoprotein SmD3b-like [Ipomoea batatas]GMD58174.1 small nuclear ribonucleoprotein SmD3b-like [Ipomoea batatas]